MNVMQHTLADPQTCDGALILTPLNAESQNDVEVNFLSGIDKNKFVYM